MRASTSRLKREMLQAAIDKRQEHVEDAARFIKLNALGQRDRKR